MAECGAPHPDAPGVTCVFDEDGPHGFHRPSPASDALPWPNAADIPPVAPPRAPGARKEQPRDKNNRTMAEAAKALSKRLRGVRDDEESWENQTIAYLRIEPKVGTRQQQVLGRLLQADGEWVSGIELATASCGGSQGLKRVRELRGEMGWPIERRPDPGSETTWQYRLIDPRLEST